MGLGRVDRVRAQLDLAPVFPVITVGGTNGKGSTCVMIEAILGAAGYRTGCYTSPHLLRYNERVRIGGREVSDEMLCDAFEAVEAARRISEVSLTYFEFGTLAAVQLFKIAGVEVAILEVGLGGRLDAVNVFDPDVAVITSIDLDHTDYLGNTREQIGREKAGIFRSGRPAICAERNLPSIVREYANEVGARFLHIGEHFGYLTSEKGWSYWSEYGKRHALPYPALRGGCQLDNASAGLAALDAIKDRLPVTMGNIRDGLLDVQWPARFQVLPGRPVTVLDVAHNLAAAKVLAESLFRMGRFNKTYGVFAMLRDKDIEGVVRALAGQINIWLAAGIDAPRGASTHETAEAVREALRENGEPVEEDILTFHEPAAAYVYACERAGVNDRICIFGSFHTVAEVLRYRETVERG
jgi:dihydrofolate synthase / folylpolyglutamate synthase